MFAIPPSLQVVASSLNFGRDTFTNVFALQGECCPPRAHTTAQGLYYTVLAYLDTAVVRVILNSQCGRLFRYQYGGVSLSGYYGRRSVLLIVDAKSVIRLKASYCAVLFRGNPPTIAGLATACLSIVLRV